MLSSCSNKDNKNTAESTSVQFSDSNHKSETEIIEENDYYKITYSDYMYYYYIFDKNHNTAKLDGPLNRRPHLSITDDGLVRFTLQAGTGIGTQYGYYYNVKSDKFSDIFHCILDQNKNLIAYTESEKIIVRDIFNKSNYYYEITTFQKPFSKTVTPITDAEFAADGKSITVSYKTGENYDSVTETFSLD